MMILPAALTRAAVRARAIGVGLVVFASLGALAPDIAHAGEQLIDATDRVTIDVGTPQRSRRSTTATVNVAITNASAESLFAPLRLVVAGLTATVSLANADGNTASGAPFIDLGSQLGDGVFAPGETVSGIVLTIANGGRIAFTFAPGLEATVPTPLSIQIDTPQTLVTVGASPIAVSGTVSDGAAAVSVNGTPVAVNNSQFSTAAALRTGHNAIVARAVDRFGQEASDTVSVSLDDRPPFLTIESHKDGDTVHTATVDISGQINDIVRGTISADEGVVTVNGIEAEISNRSYLATDVPLVLGDNLITVNGADAVGNVATKALNLSFTPPQGNSIELLDGQGQSARIRTELSAPLRVRLLDGFSVPVANKPVVFRVIQGDGVVGVGSSAEAQGFVGTTNGSGIATTRFRVGSRAGVGNQRVRVSAVGFENDVVFSASAKPNPGDKVSVIDGNNQRGVPGQALPGPLIVSVTDSGANLIEGAQIEFKVVEGGGLLQNGLASFVASTDGDGRASVEFSLGADIGLDVHRVTATLIGTSAAAGFVASALAQGAAADTTISGVVLDNQDLPVPGVTVRVEGTNREAVAGADGQFKIVDAPVGAVHLIADGSTATIPGEFPTLSYNIVTVSGADNPLPAPIYMVKLNIEQAQTVGLVDTVFELPEVPGFKLEVAANSVTFPDGSRSGQLSVTPVNANKVPMSPPNGMQPQFIVTIQPAGTQFDPPAHLTLPNVDAHPPGAQVEMYSFDHDLEEFVTIGLGTVSADGTVIASNPGVGVIKAGWHCGSQPDEQGCVDSCGPCKTADSSCSCRNDPDGSFAEQETCRACVRGAPRSISLTVSGLPGTLCVGETDSFTARLSPSELHSRGIRPTAGIATGAGSASIFISTSGDATVTGTSPHSDETTLIFKSFAVLGGSACDIDTHDLFILPRNVKGIPGKISRFTEFSFLESTCPDYPNQDQSVNHQIDGCSGGIKQDPTAAGGLFLSDPLWTQNRNLKSTEFGRAQASFPHASRNSAVLPLPCNLHDVGYQTCGRSQSASDNQLHRDMDAVCGEAYPETCPHDGTIACFDYFDERAACFAFSDAIFAGLFVGGTFAWHTRQTEYCLCCGS